MLCEVACVVCPIAAVFRQRTMTVTRCFIDWCEKKPLLYSEATSMAISLLTC